MLTNVHKNESTKMTTSISRSFQQFMFWPTSRYFEYQTDWNARVLPGNFRSFACGLFGKRLRDGNCVQCTVLRVLLTSFIAKIPTLQWSCDRRQTPRTRGIKSLKLTVLSSPPGSSPGFREKCRLEVETTILIPLI